MPAHNRRLKVITLDIDGDNYECQIVSWKFTNNRKDGDRVRTFCPDGEFIEDTDDDWMLELKFLSDWRSGGLSEYLMLHDREVVSFQLDNHPDITGEHTRWAGDLRLKAPDVGGDRGDGSEMQEVTLMVIGTPDFSRP